MRICPKCRLITEDGPLCAECGWDLRANRPSGGWPTNQAEQLRALVMFIAVMFAAGFVVSFSVTHASQVAPAMAGGLFASGLIADLFLLRLIHRTASFFREARRWTMGALLTFPFGTLVFAWLLARRVEAEKKAQPSSDIS